MPESVSRPVESGLPTVDNRTDLRNKLETLYPLIETPEMLSIRLAKEGDESITFGSFKWTGKFTQLELNILNQAVSLASEDPNLTSYCEHAQLGHPGTFKNAARDISKLLTQSSGILAEVQVGTKSGGTKRDSYRLALAGKDWQEKRYLRPKPLVEAYQLNTKIISASNKPDQIRKAVVTAAKSESVVYAVFLAFYSGMTHIEVMDLFANKDIREQLGKDVIVPALRRGDSTTLAGIKENLMVGEGMPNYGKINYQTAVSAASLSAWGKGSTKGLESMETVLHTKPFFVFLGLPEVGMAIADSSFLEPERSRTIYTDFANTFTTRVITGYLMFKEKVPSFHGIRKVI